MKYLSLAVLLLLVFFPGCDDKEEVVNPIVNIDDFEEGTSFFTFFASISNPGNVTISEYGFSYRVTTPYNTTSYDVSIGGTIGGDLSFSHNLLINELTNGTHYVKAYARVKGRTFFSREIPFVISHTPTILDIEPRQGRPGNLVIIRGRNFRNYPTVYFNDRQANIEYYTENQINAYVPWGLANGDAQVTVNVDGTNVNSPIPFTVNAGAILSITPASGTWNDIITITGENLPTENFQVQIGNSYCEIVETGPGIIKVKVNEYVATTDCVVTIISSQDYIVGPQTFTMLPAEITDFSPKQGDFNDVVTITGKNFHPVLWRNSIQIGNTAATIIESTSTTLKFQVPVNYNSPDGRSKIRHNAIREFESADEFILNAPQIFSLSPTEGVRGTKITIAGQKFNPYSHLNQITLGGLDAQIVESSQNAITIQIPYNLTRGLQEVTVTTGGQTATASDHFQFSDPWVTRNDVPNGQRQGGFSFSLGNKGYIGGGFDQGGYVKKDFYMYDPTGDTWTRKADIPINGEGITWFATSTKAYLLRYKELWQYDPATNRWTSKADFPGQGIIRQIAFGIGNYGYVGAGWYSDSGGNLYEFYKYDEASDQWTTIESAPATFSYGFGVSDGQKGYVIAGEYYSPQLYEYDPSSNSWTNKSITLYPGYYYRYHSVGISAQGKIYYGTGSDNYYNWGNRYPDMYEYNPATNSVLRIADIPNLGRQGAVGFAIGEKIYVGGGIVSNNIGGSPANDFYEYDPDYQE